MPNKVQQIEGRGFSEDEYRARVARAQAEMAAQDCAALLLTTEADVRYFTGFLTRFWESPTRPWFLVLPSIGRPIAVIPAIGAALMGATWVSDIRTWRSPDYTDDGIGLLARTLAEIVPQGGRIGVPSGGETHLRMPLSSWSRLQRSLSDRQFASDGDLIRRLQSVKSETEIAKIQRICRVAGRAFARVPEVARPGVALSTVFREFQMLCLEEGADWVPYLAGAAAPGGYADVISPADERPLRQGDVLMLDTGAVWDGYFCDFDRNFAVGSVSEAVQEAHEQLIAAVAAAKAQARPGATAADLFSAMDKVLGGGSEAGRYGHGLGMRLTEPPSLIPDDTTELVPGMVLTLEPSIEVTPGKILVHEENIVIRPHGADWLTDPAPRTLPILG